MKVITLNPGAQQEFFDNTNRASAYIGGLGSGKTYAGLARGLKFAQQPIHGYWGPRGVCATVNWPALRDIVLPQFMEMMDGTGLWKTGSQDDSYLKVEKRARLKANCGCPDRVKCPHEAEILFRSLDSPDWMRGIELSWFFIDEGRNVSADSWDILYGRLRQKGYTHAGWVCSTPNGYDWMYEKFHPVSARRLPHSNWYGAPTMENVRNVGQDYIDSLLASYHGRQLRQEVYGEFVGAVDGAVFFEWDPAASVRDDVVYDPTLPLYSFWDFGMGDLGVCLFAQIRWVETKTEGQVQPLLVPQLYILDALEATDRTSRDWVTVAKQFERDHYQTMPEMNICDPAGRQRNISTGRSIIQDMYAYGLVMTPAPKKPIDYAIRILNNMMARKGVIVSRRAERVSQALAAHKWPVDASGIKKSDKPVHDWTSHYCDAIRYGVATLLPHGPRKTAPTRDPGYTPDMWGYIEQQLLKDEDPDPWGLAPPDEEEIRWEPAQLGL